MCARDLSLGSLSAKRQSEERMDRTVPTIVHQATAVTALTLPISLGGLIRLELRQFLL